jgi:D-glycero-alpha-D-manno-heptose-7-phosphate kinase
MAKTIIRCKAPLRLGLAGGGTDVSPYSDLYGGSVLNATIDMYTYTTIELLDEPKIIFEALERNERFEAPLAEKLEIDSCLPLHKGIYNRIIRDFHSGKAIPIKIMTHSDAPAGSGLGSSSTLVVSILRAFQELLNLPFGEYELAHLAYEIERLDLKMAGGKQDQYAAAFGGFNFIEFYKDDKVIVNPLRMKPKNINEFQYNLLLYYTGTSRLSAEIIKNQVKNVQDKKRQSIEAMHKLKEQAIMMKEALLKGEVDKIGGILDYGWKYKKEISGNITNPLIDELYETALQNGAIGGKVTGAGGGGFMMLYCNGLRRFEIIESLEKFGGRFVDFQFSENGAEVWRI